MTLRSPFLGVSRALPALIAACADPPDGGPAAAEILSNNAALTEAEALLAAIGEENVLGNITINE